MGGFWFLYSGFARVRQQDAKEGTHRTSTTYSLRNVAVCNDLFTIVCHHLFTITLITTFHTRAITLANTRRSLGGTSAKLRSCGSTHTW